MSDTRQPRLPATWSEAFSALPTAEPPDRWPAIAAHAVPRRSRAIGGFAIAATLVVALALPWTLQHEATTKQPHAAPPSAASASDTELESLYAQSAQLEALLAYVRDDRVATGSAEAVSAQLDQRLAAIDANLAQPGLSATQQRELWRQRVVTLRSLASFESNRRLLSARGESYDGALVRVD